MPGRLVDGKDQEEVAKNADRRRLVRTAIGSAVLFAAAILFGLGQSRPTHFESSSNYALAPSAAGAFGGEQAYLPTDETARISDAPKEPAIKRKRSPQISKAPSPAEAHAEHDAYCNLYASAVTGNVSPEQETQRAQANGAIAGAIGGAVLGAMFGSSGRHSGRSSLLGASAGLLAGTAIGSSNARAAADDIRKRYAEAYSTCMTQKDGAAQPGS